LIFFIIVFKGVDIMFVKAVKIKLKIISEYEINKIKEKQIKNLLKDYSNCKRCGLIIKSKESYCDRCKSITNDTEFYLKEAYEKELKERQMKTNNQPRVWAKAKIKSKETIESYLKQMKRAYSLELLNSYFEKEIEILAIDYIRTSLDKEIVYYNKDINVSFYDWMFVPGSFRLLIDEEQAQKMLREVNTDYSDNVREILKDFIYKPIPKEKSKVEEFKEFIKNKKEYSKTEGYYLVADRVQEKALEIIQRLEEENTKLKEGKQ